MLSRMRTRTSVREGGRTFDISAAVGPPAREPTLGSRACSISRSLCGSADVGDGSPKVVPRRNLRYPSKSWPIREYEVVLHALSISLRRMVPRTAAAFPIFSPSTLLVSCRHWLSAFPVPSVNSANTAIGSVT